MRTEIPDGAILEPTPEEIDYAMARARRLKSAAFHAGLTWIVARARACFGRLLTSLRLKDTIREGVVRKSSQVSRETLRP